MMNESWRVVEELVCKHFGVSVDDMRGRSRVRDIVDARQFVWFIEPSRDKCLRDEKTHKFDVKMHDEGMKDANETIRLHMLHYDRSYQNPENTKKIFDFLESLESQGIFTNKDTEQFKR